MLKKANVLFACMGIFKFYDFMVSAVTVYKYTDLSIEEIKILFSWKRENSKFASNPTVISNIASFSHEIIGRFLFICGK